MLRSSRTDILSGTATNTSLQVAVYPKLLQLAALVNGRMFVGLPLARDQEWINLNIKYTLDVVNTVRAVGQIHPMLRRIRAPYLPEVKHLAEYKKRAEVILRPHITATIEAKKEISGKKDADRLKFNLIAWMMDQMQGVDYQLLAAEQLFACKCAQLSEVQHKFELTTTSIWSDTFVMHSGDQCSI